MFRKIYSPNFPKLMAADVSKCGSYGKGRGDRVPLRCVKPLGHEGNHLQDVDPRYVLDEFLPEFLRVGADEAPDRDAQVDAKAREILLDELKAAVGKDVEIERVRLSPGDTQYRVRGTLDAFYTGAVHVTVNGSLRRVDTDKIIRITVYGRMAEGIGRTSTTRSQYDWIEEARRFVDAGIVTVDGEIAWNRHPVDTMGAALVPQAVYRFADRRSGSVFFGIYVDAVVEDDDSLTVVIENARGDREGLSANRYEASSLIPQACGGLEVGPARDPIDEVEAYRG